MIVNNVKKKSIALAARKGIRDIKEDPHRSIRNLVDLAMHLSTGRFRKEFLKNAQNMLSNSQSPYYTLVNKFVNLVSPKFLETYVVNLGYMSWTYGARFIREYEKEQGYNVPWTIQIDFDNELPNAIDICSVISQGKKLGIYSYIVSADKTGDSCQDIITAVESNKDCAFIVIVNSKNSLMEFNFNDYNFLNVLTLINYCDDDFDEMAEMQKENKRLYGVWYNYDDDNVSRVLDGTMIEELQHGDNTMLFLVKTPDCTDDAEKKVSAFTHRCRVEQTYSMMISDFYSDIKYIDNIVSDEACMMGIRGDGAIITEGKVYENVNIGSIPLVSVMEMLMPKVEKNSRS